MLEGLKCFLTLQSGMRGGGGRKKKESISLVCQSFVGLCPTAALTEGLQREESKCTQEMSIKRVL